MSQIDCGDRIRSGDDAKRESGRQRRIVRALFLIYTRLQEVAGIAIRRPMISEDKLGKETRNDPDREIRGPSQVRSEIPEDLKYT